MPVPTASKYVYYIYFKYPTKVYTTREVCTSYVATSWLGVLYWDAAYDQVYALVWSLRQLGNPLHGPTLYRWHLKIKKDEDEDEAKYTYMSRTIHFTLFKYQGCQKHTKFTPNLTSDWIWPASSPEYIRRRRARGWQDTYLMEMPSREYTADILSMLERYCSW